MSWAKRHEKKLRARFVRQCAAFNEARGVPEVFAKLLANLVASDIQVWPIAEAVARVTPLGSSERAMIAQAVAPRLAGMTPGSVWHRHAQGRDVTNLKSQSPVSRPTN